MSRRVVLRPEARRELFEARDWYERRSPGLGFEFVRAIDAALAMIQRFPRMYPMVEGAVRRALVRRFPYQIIYEVSDNQILVIACFHHRRNPETWRSRVKPKSR